MELTIQHNGKTVTTSLLIAKHFGKDHWRVLRKIQNLECPFDFRNNNFVVSSYQSEQNKEMPMYYLTKDAFSFLVMGFTGKKASKFKIDFINAFNEMERQLKEQPLSLAEMTVKVIEGQKQQIAQLKATTEHQTQVINLQAPKVEYHDTVLQSTDTLTATQLAKSMEFKSAKAFNEWLRQQGIHWKVGGQWVLYSPYANKGLTKTVTHPYTKSDGTQGTAHQTVWTEKGRKFCHLFKEEGKKAANQFINQKTA